MLSKSLGWLTTSWADLVFSLWWKPISAKSSRTELPKWEIWIARKWSSADQQPLYSLSGSWNQCWSVKNWASWNIFWSRALFHTHPDHLQLAWFYLSPHFSTAELRCCTVCHMLRQLPVIRDSWNSIWWPFLECKLWVSEFFYLVIRKGATCRNFSLKHSKINQWFTQPTF